MLHLCGLSQRVWILAMVCLSVGPLLSVATHPASAEMTCPEAPKQIDKDVYVDGKTRIGAIGPFKAGEIDGKVTIIGNDLIKQYPKAEKIFIAQLLVSFTCEALKNSRTLTDQQIIDQINSLSTKLLTAFSEEQHGEATPDIQPEVVGTGDNKDVLFQNKGGPLYNLESELLENLVINLHAPPCGLQANFYKEGAGYGYGSPGDETVFSLDEGTNIGNLQFSARRLKYYFGGKADSVEIMGFYLLRLRYEDARGSKHERYYEIHIDTDWGDHVSLHPLLKPRYDEVADRVTLAKQTHKDFIHLANIIIEFNDICHSFAIPVPTEDPIGDTVR
jgi:hypothetical protein